MNKKGKEILWGMLLIATAIFIIFMKLGFLHEISIVKIIFTVIFSGIIITSIPSKNFAGILFPIAFLCIIYDKEWGIEALTPIPVIIIAVLGSLGLSLIFKKNCHNYGCNNEKWQAETVNGIPGEKIECEARFNKTTKHIKSANLNKINIRSSFGGIEVYFDEVFIPSGKAEIFIEASFGGVFLYIPKNWKIVFSADNSFGGIDEKNRPEITENSPVVLLTGNVNFAGVQIIYI